MQARGRGRGTEVDSGDVRGCSHCLLLDGDGHWRKHRLITRVVRAVVTRRIWRKHTLHDHEGSCHAENMAETYTA